SPPRRSVADQRLGRIVGTGRQEPARPPDQGRQRQLVAPVGRADAAFIEGAGESHATALIPRRTGRGNRTQAAPARLVRPSARAPCRAARMASSVASMATMVEAWRAG